MTLQLHLSVQFISVAQLCPTLCDPRDCSTPGFPVHHQLLELAQTHVHKVSDAIQRSHPLLSLLLPPSVFPSIRVFSSESVLHIRWPKYWSFSFSISPSSEYSGLVYFRIGWLISLQSKGLDFKRLLQYHSSKASSLQHSAFFTVQLSHPSIALTGGDLCWQMLLNMLSRLVITFLPRSKYLLISWLQSPFVMILE